MSLINREALLSYADLWASCGEHYTAEDVIMMIKTAPTVDAVPVVRKPVVGYERYYEVDQFGRVFSVERVVSVDDNGRKYEKPVSGKQMTQC